MNRVFSLLPIAFTLFTEQARAADIAGRVIAGQVIDAQTGAPIARAHIALHVVPVAGTQAVHR